MATHIPPTLRVVFSPATCQDLELWVNAVVTDAVRVAVADASTSPWLTAVEAARILRCDRRRIDDLCSAGRLRRHHEGRRLLLSRVEVEALVSEEVRRGR